MSKASIALLSFIVGVAAGALVMLEFRSSVIREATVARTAGEAAVVANAEDTGAAISSSDEGIVEYAEAVLVADTEIASFEGEEASTALLLPAQQLAIVRLIELDGAQAVDLKAPYDHLSLQEVVAIDPEIGLAALQLRGLESKIETLKVPQDSISFGRECLALSPAGAQAVSVDSPLLRFADGTLGYEAGKAADHRYPLSALIDEASKQLIGLLYVDPRVSRTARAYDIDVIERLLAGDRDARRYSLFELREAFFESTADGALVRFREAFATKNFSRAVELGRELLAGQGVFWREQLEQPMQASLVALAAQWEQEGGSHDAIEMLIEADSYLPRQFPREQKLIALLYWEDRTEQALERARYWMLLGKRDGLIELHRKLVLDVIADELLNDTERLAHLNDAITLDPDFSEFFVRRGELFFSQGEYIAALGNFEQAIAVDPTLARKLAKRIDQANARADANEVVIVPIQRSGGILSAEVFVNGTPLQFIVDTGASVTAVSGEVAELLELNEYGGSQVATAGGLLNVNSVTLYSVELAGAPVYDLSAVVLDELSGYDGLLGLDYLSNFSVDIDTDLGEMLLSPR
ncbi:MAG: retropepsin-like aspartic protease [Pseudomonadota bacterium]